MPLTRLIYDGTYICPDTEKPFKLIFMAKIVGPVPPFIGTRDNVTIYLMNGEYIARSKSSLTGKRVKKDPAFARTMEWAGRLKQGARIASSIYRQMPVEGRVYKQYREITGKAMSLLKEGFSKEDIITMLEAVYLPQQENNIESIITCIKPEAEQENNGTYNSEYRAHSVGTMVCNAAYNSQYPVHSVDTIFCNAAYNSQYPVHSVDTMVCNSAYNSQYPVHSIGTMVCNGAYNSQYPVHSIDTMFCNGVYNSEYPVHPVDTMVCNSAYNSQYPVHSIDTMVCNGAYNSQYPVHSIGTMGCNSVYNSEYPVHSVDTMVCNSAYNSQYPVHSVGTRVCNSAYNSQYPVHLAGTTIRNGAYNSRYIQCDQYSYCNQFNQCNQSIQRDKKAELISIKLQSNNPSCEQCMAYNMDALLLLGRPYAASGQVGITGLSCLKYADVPHQEFNRITKAKPSFKS